jgi:hypothetical protein
MAVFSYIHILFMMENNRKNNVNKFRKLSIEIDNCAKKGKNMIVLAFLLSHSLL